MVYDKTRPAPQGGRRRTGVGCQKKVMKEGKQDVLF
jgi:hypothetical protein